MRSVYILPPGCALHQQVSDNVSVYPVLIMYEQHIIRGMQDVVFGRTPTWYVTWSIRAADHVNILADRVRLTNHTLRWSQAKSA